MATRSFQLRAGIAGASSTGTVYTVSSTRTVILKHIAVTNPTQVATYVNLMLSGSGPQLIALNLAVAAGSTSERLPWLVLEPGQSLQLNAGPAGDIHYVLSGALLEGTAE